MGVPLDKIAQTLSAYIGLHLAQPDAVWLVTLIVFLVFWVLALWVLSRFLSRPHIRITVGENGPYFNTGGSGTRIERTYNLKVENIGSKSLSGCTVKLKKNSPLVPYDEEGVLCDNLSIAGGDHVFLPLVIFGEHSDSFATSGTKTGRPYLDKGVEYKITVRATAMQSAPCDFKCKVWVDETGKLRIKKA